MSREKADIFLSKIDERIAAGEFDKFLDIPFASRKLLKSLIHSKIENKLESGSTAILSENNIDECVAEVRETAATTAGIFLELGFLQRDELGKIIPNPKISQL